MSRGVGIAKRKGWRPPLSRPTSARTSRHINPLAVGLQRPRQKAGSRSVLDVERVTERLVETDTRFEAQMADGRGVEDAGRNGDHVVTADHAGLR